MDREGADSHDGSDRGEADPGRIRARGGNLDQISAEELAGDYPAVEYVPPHGRYSIDILTRLGEAFRYETLEFEELLLDGIRIRVATPAMLYRMKKDTVRPQDRLDAETIRREFGLGTED